MKLRGLELKQFIFSPLFEADKVDCRCPSCQQGQMQIVAHLLSLIERRQLKLSATLTLKSNYCLIKCVRQEIYAKRRAKAAQNLVDVYKNKKKLPEGAVRANHDELDHNNILAILGHPYFIAQILYSTTLIIVH